MDFHNELGTSELFQRIKRQTIQYAGNARLKIYGRLDCKSGKRMRKQNRVFFKTEEEASQLGFRPCGHCMQTKYQEWGNKIDQLTRGNTLHFHLHIKQEAGWPRT